MLLTAMILGVVRPRTVHLQTTAVAANWPRLVALHPARLALETTVAGLSVANLGRPVSTVVSTGSHSWEHGSEKLSRSALQTGAVC